MRLLDATSVLRVVWQDPTTREFFQVATLTYDNGADPAYRFRYVHPLPSSFHGFAAFPDVRRDYESDALFPFFVTRVMSAASPDYDAYLSSLGLSREDATPVELMGRTGATRATDTVQIVPVPAEHPDGSVEQVFLASGVRYFPEAEDVLATLRPGDELVIRPQPENSHDPRALLLDAKGTTPVGYVPSYLLDEVHKWRSDRAVACFVERVNSPETPPHLRLLCRLRASPRH